MVADVAEIRRAIELDAADVAGATSNPWILADHVCRSCSAAMAQYHEIDPSELIEIGHRWLTARRNSSVLAAQARDLIAAAAQCLLCEEAARLKLIREGRLA